MLLHKSIAVASEQKLASEEIQMFLQSQPVLVSANKTINFTMYEGGKDSRVMTRRRGKVQVSVLGFAVGLKGQTGKDKQETGLTDRQRSRKGMETLP